MTAQRNLTDYQLLLETMNIWYTRTSQGLPRYCAAGTQRQGVRKVEMLRAII